MHYTLKTVQTPESYRGINNKWYEEQWQNLLEEEMEKDNCKFDKLQLEDRIFFKYEQIRPQTEVSLTMTIKVTDVTGADCAEKRRAKAEITAYFTSLEEGERLAMIVADTELRFE